MARGDSSDSSEVDEDWQDQGYRVQQSAQEPARRYGSRDVGSGLTQGYIEPLPAHAKVERSASKDEARDTLSALCKFPSPQIGTSIPSSHLDFSASSSASDLARDIEDAEADDEAGEDDTAATGISFLSSSSGGDNSRDYMGEVPHPQGASSSSASSFGAPRHYTGLGLGLPFSMSAAANLSSLSPGLSPPASAYTQSRAVSDEQGIPRSPSGEEQSRSFSGPESPVTDRSKLIGLGELATPRWTSGPLERKWGTPYDEKRRASREEGELDASATAGHDPMVSRAAHEKGSHC